MAAIRSAFIEKLERLPPQRLAEVEDFVEFLASREARATACARLGESLTKLDTVNLQPLSDEEIEAEIEAARKTHAIRHT